MSVQCSMIPGVGAGMKQPPRIAVPPLPPPPPPPAARCCSHPRQRWSQRGSSSPGSRSNSSSSSSACLRHAAAAAARPHRAAQWRCRSQQGPGGPGGSSGGSGDADGTSSSSSSDGSPEAGDGSEGTRVSGSGGSRPPQGSEEVFQNVELLVGDVLCLLCFALYKQIDAIILLPTFPGWLAPLRFNPTRFLEFFSFAATLIGTWVASGMLTGGYKFAASADLQAALNRTCRMWLASMPVAAAQLVLLTAAEGGSLVGDEGFASALPLAASGPGEPFVTAAGVLGLMCMWRAFYAAYLDLHSFRSAAASRRNREREMQHFADSLRGAALLSLAFCALLQGLGGLVGEEQLELLLSSLLR